MTMKPKLRISDKPGYFTDYYLSAKGSLVIAGIGMVEKNHFHTVEIYVFSRWIPLDIFRDNVYKHIEHLIPSENKINEYVQEYES